jgi:uncharacterized protein
MEFVTPQEQQLLTQLTQRINETQLQEKDPDAENLLGHELGSNPDAIYILAQTVLVQNIALDQAKAQIAQLQQQLQQSHQPAHTTSFLGRLLGDRDPEPVQPQPLQNQQGQFQQPPYQPVPQYAQTPPQYAPAPPQYGQPQYQQAQYVPVQGGQPSFLRGAMQTAAGVAAGALAFEGVESILHGIGGGHGGYGMMGSGMGMGGGFDRPGGETVVNNYYDGAGGGGDNLRGFESGDPHSHEPADRLDDGAAGKSYDAVTGDNSADSLAGLDDSGSDDTSAFDSGQDDGGGDSGGGDSL